MSKDSKRRRRQNAIKKANEAALGKASGQKGKPVTIIQDHALEFPELWLEVYVATDDEQEKRLINQLFARAKCTRAIDIEHADIVVFGGGADVDPALYSKKPHPMTHIDPDRDKRDMDMYQQCLESGTPMVGICRGMQFGWVMLGGALYQHVDNHVGDHSMWNPSSKFWLSAVSSVHHQMIKWEADTFEKTGAILLGCSRASKVRYEEPKIYEEGPNMDVEAFFHPGTCFLGVQGHPEYQGYPRFAQWFIEQIKDFIVENPHMKVQDGYIRIPPFDRNKDERMEKAKEGARRVLSILNDQHDNDNTAGE